MTDRPVPTEPSGDILPLLVENQQRFLAFLSPRLRSVEDAEDILQSAYAKSVSVNDSVAEESAVAWFYQVLRNAITDYYRRADVESRALKRLGEVAEQQSGTWEKELHGVVCRCVDELIPTLKDDYADVIRKVDLEGVSVSKAAVALGISASNAGVRLHRARLALKSRLEQTCLACATHGCLDCSCKEKS